MKFAPTLLLFVAVSVCGFPQTNVLTANYDNNRTSANLSETVLNTWNVNPAQFGKLYAYSVDGQVYAQPLYVSGVLMPTGAKRNVLIVATLHNSVYAFDADSAGPPLWHVSLGKPVDPLQFYSGYKDILNEVGILSTPVIDATTNTIYVANETAEESSISFYLHALDLLTGSEKFHGPVPIQASVLGSGTPGGPNANHGVHSFVGANQLQRTGLLLADGSVYLGFGSHGDITPWHGWLLGYNAATLKQNMAFCTTPSNIGGGAIWQGGRGIAANAGRLYVSTGNGDYDGANTWSESVLRLSGNGTLTDWFTPAEWSDLNERDQDFGSNGPILVPGSNLMITGGKAGVVALLDRTRMGQEVTSNSQIVQSFQASDSGGFAIFNAALWPNSGGPYYYLFARDEPLRAYRLVNGLFNTAASSANTTITSADPRIGFSVSANRSLATSGILWLTTVPTNALPAPGTLHALNASNITEELWNSDMEGARDTLGSFSKFANPTVANGKVFAPTAGKEVLVYGLLPGVPGIVSVVNAASFQSSSVAPGELVTVFGNRIGPSSGVAATLDEGLRQFPFQLGGVQVTFDGLQGPLLYVASGQINTVVPFGISGSSTLMSVTTPAGGSFSVTLPVSAAAPAVFSRDGAGSGFGAILNHPDYSQNTPANPASRGSYVAMFVTGAGPISPTGIDGQIAKSDTLPLVAQTVKVSIGGHDASVVYQGAAPGLINGVTQINVKVPESTEPGPAVPVTLTVGGIPSQNTVIMAVQ